MDELTWDEFDTRFDGLIIPTPDGSDIHETFGYERDRVIRHRDHRGEVWTVVDVDCEDCEDEEGEECYCLGQRLIPGYHTVNRAGYVLLREETS